MLLEVVLIVGRHDLDADGADGDVLVDQNLIRFIPADIGLDAPGGQPAVGRQLFPGDGVIASNAQALRQGELQQGVLMKGKVVDLNVVEVLLSIGPVGTLPDFLGDFPAEAQGPILVIVGVGGKTVALQHGYIVWLRHFGHNKRLASSLQRLDELLQRRDEPRLKPLQDVQTACSV